MARPYWSGTIQISLVSFAVKFFVATESKSEIRFHQISRSTGERIRQQKVLQSNLEQAAGDDSASVQSASKDDIVKGYEYRKGEYVMIEPSELANLRVASKHSISVEQFVDERDIDPAYFEKPYFVAPDGDNQAEAFAVVRKALQAARKVGLGKIAFGGREHVVAIKATDNDDEPGLMAYTLRYQEELRKPQEYFSDIKKVEIEQDQLELAEQLIRKKAAKFDPSRFKDSYEQAVRELVEAKVNNQPVPQDEPQPKRAKVINLMDALRSSLKSAGIAHDSSDEDSSKPEPPRRSARAEKKPAAHEAEPAARKAEASGPTLVRAEKKPAAKAAGTKSSGRRKSA